MITDGRPTSEEVDHKDRKKTPHPNPRVICLTQQLTEGGEVCSPGGAVDCFASVVGDADATAWDDCCGCVTDAVESVGADVAVSVVQGAIVGDTSELSGTLRGAAVGSVRTAELIRTQNIE